MPIYTEEARDIDYAQMLRRPKECFGRTCYKAEYIPGYVPQIQRVIFNSPATIVFWSDNTKTVIKCQPDDTFSKEAGLAMAICKKACGNSARYNNLFKKWVIENV